jgi:copper transport protein
MRFLLYAALLAAAGGALFLGLVIGDRPALHAATRRYALTAAAIAAVTAILTLGTEGGLLTLPPFPSGFLKAATWREGAGSPQGDSVAFSLLGLALLGMTLRRRGSPARPLLLAGAAISLAGLAATGHAATAPPRWLTAPAVLLHALVAALWIGSLWPLARVLRTAPLPEGAAVVRRFSTAAAVALALLVGSGACLAVVQVGSLAALAGTQYGRFLIAKLGLALALCFVAAFNKWRLTPALSGPGGSRAALRLRRSIGVELGLAAFVLTATVALGLVPPPRALALSEGVTAALVSPRGIEARLRVIPALAGRNTIEVSFTRDGAPLDPAEATLELSLPEAGIEPLTQALVRVGPGAFRADNVALAPSGSWHVRLEALIGDFEREAYETNVVVRPRAP